MFNYDEIKKTINFFKPNCELFEIRIITKEKKIYSGYFKNVDIFLFELKKLEKLKLRNPQFYIVLNEIKEDCYCKEQRNKFLVSCSTTKDDEITKYKWLFIDVDPKRLSDISSTNAELNRALDKRNDIYLFLKKNGFEEPVIALSGNGCHLLYQIDILNTKENEELIKRFIYYLDLRFSDNDTNVDTTVYNPARICKLYGTLAQKGSDTEDRPHRFSKIECFNDNKVNSIELIKRISNMYPNVEKESVYKNSGNYNLQDFFKRHNIGIKMITNDKSGIKYILEECPFDSSHNKDSPAVFQLSNGAIGFKCFHNSCSNNGWKEFRKCYESNYDEYSTNPYISKNTILPSSLTENNNLNKKYLYSVDEINKIEINDDNRVITNIKELDKMLGGFTYDCVTLWASQTNGGKTTLMTMLTREFIRQGRRVFYFNGEQSKENFLNNLILLNAPKENIKKIEYKNTGIFDRYVDEKTRNNELSFYKDKLYIYNNEAPRDIDSLIISMESARKQLGIRDFVIDNLMQIDIAGSDVFREQERLTEKLRTFAINTRSNIHLVAHSRKTNSNQIRLTLFDIAGSQNIANKSYNIITITRIDQIDQTSSEYEKLKKDLLNSNYNINEIDGVLEVLKYKYALGRSGLVGLKYDVEQGTYVEVSKHSIAEIEIMQAELEKQNSPKIQKRPKNKYYYD